MLNILESDLGYIQLETFRSIKVTRDTKRFERCTSHLQLPVGNRLTGYKYHA